MLIKMSTLSIVICFFCAPRYVLKYQSVLVLFVYSMKTYWLNFSRPCGQLMDYCTQTAIVHAIDQAIQFFDRLVEHVAVVCHIYVQRRAFFALLFQSCIFTFVIFFFHAGALGHAQERALQTVYKLGDRIGRARHVPGSGCCIVAILPGTRHNQIGWHRHLVLRDWVWSRKKEICNACARAKHLLC